MRLLVLLFFVVMSPVAKSQIFGVEVGDTVSIQTKHLSFSKQLEGVKLRIDADIEKDIVKSLEIVPENGHTSNKELDKILMLTRKYYHIDKQKEKIRKCYKMGGMHEIIEYKDSHLRMLVELQDDLKWKMKIS